MPTQHEELQPLLDAIREKLGLDSDEEVVGLLLHNDVMDSIGSEFARAGQTATKSPLRQALDRTPIAMSATAADARDAKLQTFIDGLRAASGLDQQSITKLLLRNANKIADQLAAIMNNGQRPDEGVVLALSQYSSRPQAILMSKLAMRKQELAMREQQIATRSPSARAATDPKPSEAVVRILMNSGHSREKATEMTIAAMRKQVGS
jgi:hypothetical protein